MTEKRFTYEQETLAKVNVFDSDGEFICCTLSIWADQLVDKLNALHEENEQLKHDATVLIQANQDYRKENEQLKKENKELKMDKDSLATGFDEYQVQVAETLQKHYNQTLNTHIARFVKLLADELGIDLQ